MITIADFGMGNLGSIVNMCRRISVDCEVTSDPSCIALASRLMLPGVGSFDAAMNKIEVSGIRQVLDQKALIEQYHTWHLLGMQLLTRSSEEGSLPGLVGFQLRLVVFRATLI